MPRAVPQFCASRILCCPRCPGRPSVAMERPTGRGVELAVPQETASPPRPVLENGRPGSRAGVVGQDKVPPEGDRGLRPPGLVHPAPGLVELLVDAVVQVESVMDDAGAVPPPGPPIRRTGAGPSPRARSRRAPRSRELPGPARPVARAAPRGRRGGRRRTRSRTPARRGRTRRRSGPVRVGGGRSRRDGGRLPGPFARATECGGREQVPRGKWRAVLARWRRR